MIYQSKPRSYRDLPVRLAEFGTVFRYEQSGELSGLTRVRSFTQDDAHLFCTEDQVADEFRGCVEMTQAKLAEVDNKIASLQTIKTALEVLIDNCPGKGALRRCSIIEALTATDEAVTVD